MSDTRPDLRHAWYVVGVLMAVYMIGFVDRQILALLVAPVKASLGLTDVQIGLLQGFAFVMLFALLGVPMGALADRHGKRPVLTLGIVIWCAFTAACGYAGGFWSLFLFRVGVGLGEATISPCCLALIAQNFPPERRALATSVFVASGSVGVGLAFTLGGQVVDAVARLPQLRLLGPIAGEPWRVAFVLVGLAGLALLPLMATIREAAPRPAPSAAHAASQGELLAFVRANRRLLLRHLGAFAAFSAIAYGVLAWAPSYFIRGFGWTPSEFGLVFGLAFAVPSVAGTILGGWWSSRLRRAGQLDANFRLMTWGLAGVGLPAALAPIVPSAPLAMLLYGIVAFFLSFPTGCSAAAVQDYTPPQLRGRVTALYYTAVSLGGVGLGPLVVGILTDHVFRSEGLVGRSLAVSSALFGATACLLVIAAAREFRRREG
ncbi:MAG: MFS transporter [Steroidobacteraceae bacterium]|jgi:MFS family permease|nr:MFS transporter [Steroidobacteraceae bacterium]